MLRSIGMIACGIALLCSTVWADEEKTKKLDQLSSLMGLWEFSFTVPPDGGSVRRWYVLDKLHGNSLVLTGFAPNIQRSKIRIIAGNRGDNSNQYMVMAEEIDGPYAICRTFLIEPPDYAPATISGFFNFVRSKRTVLNEEMESVQPGLNCDWDKKIRGSFLGIQSW